MPENDEIPEELDSVSRSRAATAAFVVCCVLVLVFVAGAWFRLRDESGGDHLQSLIRDGKRPVAPALPTSSIPGDGAPGLEAVREGRPKLVNFWASWCAPCVAEAPILRDVADRFAGRVEFVGVNAGNEDLLSKARAFVRRHDLTFPMVRGDRADKRTWGVVTYPETFLVGADGTISWHLAGPLERDELVAVIEQELERGRS